MEHDVDDSHRYKVQSIVPELVVVELGEEEILVLVSCRKCGAKSR